MPGRGPLMETGKKVVLSAPVHARLSELSAELRAIRGREVTFSECIEELFAHLDGTSRLLADVMAAHDE